MNSNIQVSRPAYFIILISFLFAVCLCPMTVWAKRAAPKAVNPIVHDGVEYRARDMCFVEAVELATGKKLS